ncbi:uncharacterized protein LOC129962124 [Argiope bruennichi]|uniref:uncharacterized protein LOC129962124 n=1 Tax=Argiope bruennichi TaxID=94029 RepID=UPI0024943628|nr:uncharacterized protein LOC129962124 [Argiope bruennichi]
MNCVDCILCNRKRGKGEGLLNPIPKDNTPLSTYHIDFIGPLQARVKSTSAAEALQKLKIQQAVFGHPSRIISDKGSAFTSKDFEDYCKDEGIQHIRITTGVPIANGQIERMHRILIPVLAKLSIDDSAKWLKFVPNVQRIINSTISRSTKFTLFELMTEFGGPHMSMAEQSGKLTPREGALRSSGDTSSRKAEFTREKRTSAEKGNTSSQPIFPLQASCISNFGNNKAGAVKPIGSYTLLITDSNTLFVTGFSWVQSIFAGSLQESSTLTTSQLRPSTICLS